eukprot:2070711-Alexandrium_andersonii.AAC.1
MEADCSTGGPWADRGLHVLAPCQEQISACDWLVAAVTDWLLPEPYRCPGELLRAWKNWEELTR